MFTHLLSVLIRNDPLVNISWNVIAFIAVSWKWEWEREKDTKKSKTAIEIKSEDWEENAGEER